MRRSRHLLPLNARLVFMLAMMALGMNALIPAGYMVAPSSTHFVSVTMCPETNPLARAVLAADRLSPMGGSPIDHAAMGHAVPPLDEQGPSASRANADCAFSALATAADIPEQGDLPSVPPEPSEADDTPLKLVPLGPQRNLRPPLRGPPARL